MPRLDYVSAHYFIDFIINELPSSEIIIQRKTERSQKGKEREMRSGATEFKTRVMTLKPAYMMMMIIKKSIEEMMSNNLCVREKFVNEPIED